MIASAQSSSIALLPGFGEKLLGHVVIGLKVVHAELDGVESAQPFGHAVITDRRVHLVHPLAAPDDDPEPVREARHDLQRGGARRRHYHVAGHLAGIVQSRVIEAADGQRVEPFGCRRACRPDDAGRDNRFVGPVLDVRERAVAGLQRRDVNFGAGELYVARHVGKHPVVGGRADRIQVHQLQRAVVCHFNSSVSTPNTSRARSGETRPLRTSARTSSGSRSRESPPAWASASPPSLEAARRQHAGNPPQHTLVPNASLPY